jgi:hypothetical protein
MPLHKRGVLAFITLKHIQAASRARQVGLCCHPSRNVVFIVTADAGVGSISPVCRSQTTLAFEVLDATAGAMWNWEILGLITI